MRLGFYLFPYSQPIQHPTIIIPPGVQVVFIDLMTAISDFGFVLLDQIGM